MTDDLWLDEPEGPSEPRRGSSARRAGLVAAAAVLVAAVAVPAALVIAGGDDGGHHLGAPVSRAEAEHHVLQALSATTDSGSFDLSYKLSQTPPTATPATTTTTAGCNTPVQSAVAPGGGPVAPGDVVECIPATTQPDDLQVAGSGVIDTSPMAMVVSAQIGTASSPDNGIQVTVRVDPTTVYENLGTLVPTLAPPPADQNETGSLIPAFAGLTESTLGPRLGAVAMLGMASPTGYLNLDQASITSADQTGTGTVGGVPVTVYQVTEDPSQLENAPGVSPEESSAVRDAMGVLDQQGYTGTSVTVSVDASGFIRQATSTARFSDGATVVLDATMSDFGCAGTVLMPGQTGDGSAAAGCATPDTGTAPTTTTVPPATTTVPPTTSTTGPAVTTPTTVPGTTPTTQGDGSTTTLPSSVPPADGIAPTG